MAARQGGTIGENTTYRVYAKYHNTQETRSFGPWDSDDGWFGVRSGFRLDSKPSEEDSFTLQGDVNFSETGPTTLTWTHTPPFSEVLDNDRKVDNQNLLGRWSRTLSSRSHLEAQLYYDRVNRKDIVLDQEVNTIDLDVQHRYRFSDWNEVVYGAGYRYYRDDLACSKTLIALPEQRTFDLLTWFLQDEITILPEKLRLILGSKFEVNAFSGFNYQPNARVVYFPSDGQTVWGAVSRAVRTPSRLENDVLLNFAAARTPDGAPLLVTGIGNQDLEEESLLAYELGYRVEVSRSTFVDVTTFYNRYDHLTSLSAGQPFLDSSLRHYDYPVVIQPLYLGNFNEAQTYGAELSVDWQPLNWWRLISGYSFLEMTIDTSSSRGDVLSKNRETQSPNHQFVVRSQFDLPRDVQFDMNLRYISELRSLRVPDYTTFDMRLGWRPTKNLELSLVGQNLLEDKHREYLSQDYISTVPRQLERGVYSKATWSW